MAAGNGHGMIWKPALLYPLPLALAALLIPAVAHAHPHVWADTAAEILFDANGQIAAIRHHWRFDEGFSAYALQGLDADGDGLYSTEELEPLARENVESVGEFDYFTFLTIGDYQAGYAAPKDYHLDYDGTRLTLHYTLPLAQPIHSKSPIRLEIYDPEYYVAFALPSAEAVRLVDAPAGCRLTVHPAQEPDAAAAEALAAIGPDQRELPPEMQALTGGIENSAEIVCGEAVAAAHSSAGDAVTAMAGSGDVAGDLTALPEQMPADTPAAADQLEQPAASPGLMARIAALQTAFNRDLTAALKGLKEGGAFWWLGGISFLYGIVHAAGPGHGKVVISSYLLANEQSVRRGVLIAFAAAFVQAAVAVGLIAVLAALLNMTSTAITGAAWLFEAGSFALVAALGLYLLARKSRAALAMLRGGDPHAHHGHHHHHHHGRTRLAPRSLGAAAVHDAHDQHHGRDAASADGKMSALAAIASVGIRPCSGALVILVFALAQGIFWAGIASTFVMALGTALTVAMLAALAVGAKDVARKFAGGSDRRAGQVMLVLELFAALFITALGLTLFVGSLYA
jgi:nickel/cobalt transporter (NicO) family protein